MPDPCADNADRCEFGAVRFVVRYFYQCRVISCLLCKVWANTGKQLLWKSEISAKTWSEGDLTIFNNKRDLLESRWYLPSAPWLILPQLLHFAICCNSILNLFIIILANRSTRWGFIFILSFCLKEANEEASERLKTRWPAFCHPFVLNWQTSYWNLPSCSDTGKGCV